MAVGAHQALPSPRRQRDARPILLIVGFVGLNCLFFLQTLKKQATEPSTASDGGNVHPEGLAWLLPQSEALFGAGFRMPGYQVWGGSVIRSHTDGSHHLFVSCWEEWLGHNAWVTSSEIVHAVSRNGPYGPWRVRGAALPRRGPRHWDGMATHNPTVHWDPSRQQYVLFYIGTTFGFEPPRDAPFTNRSQYEAAWNSKRVGVAVATSLDGPWQRSSEPLLHPRPGEWDGGIISNPSAVIFQDGTVLLFYKSIKVGYPERSIASPNPVFHLGAARAPTVFGPYTRVGDGPALVIDGKPLAAEDPYLWWDATTSRLHLLFKTMMHIRDLKREDKRILVPHGHLAYTYTAAGADLTTWALPSLAFNKTIVVRGRRPNARQGLAEKADDAHVGLAAAPHLREVALAATSRSVVTRIGVRAREEDLVGQRKQRRPSTLSSAWLLKADRLERPQLLFESSPNGGSSLVPTVAYLAMMVDGSSSNVALRIRM